ncbi:MAG TPA: CAP domain-containing protein [Anaerolineales bacterium]
MKKINSPLSLLLVLFFLPLGPVSGFSRQLHPAQLSPVGNSALAAPAAFSLAQVGCGAEAVQVVNNDYEQRVVELVNEIRESQGLFPLKRTPSLDQAARYHAADLGVDDYFDHDTYDRVGENLVEVCDTWSRVATFFLGASAENIAAGYATPEAVVDGWMDSEGHKANILNTGSWEIGVGYYEGAGTFGQYWVQDFGTRSGVFPLVINGEAATTDIPAVTLYMYGSWEVMRLRNNNGDWTTWQPFTSTLEWTLESAAGEHTVSAELHSGTETVTSSDTITLTQNATPPALGNLPDAIQFTFSIPEQQIIPAYHQLTPGLVNGQGPLNWHVQSDGNFFTAMPPQGTTPDPLTIMPTSFDLGNPGTYEGTITITVVDPTGVTGSPHTIAVTLQVVETEIYQTFLPGIQN